MRLISYTVLKLSHVGLYARLCINCLVLSAHFCCATLSNYVSQAVSKLVTKRVLVFLNFTRRPVHTLQDFSASQARTCRDLSRLKQHCGCTIACPMCPRNLPSSKAVTSSLSLRFLLYQWWFGVFILKRNCSAQEMSDLVNFFTFPEVLQYCQELVQGITPQNQAGARRSRPERSRAPQPSLLAGEAGEGGFSTKWGSTAYRSSLLLV